MQEPPQQQRPGQSSHWKMARHAVLQPRELRLAVLLLQGADHWQQATPAAAGPPQLPLTALLLRRADH